MAPSDDFVGHIPTNSTLGAITTAVIAPRALRALPKRRNWRGAEVPYPAGLIAAIIGAAHPAPGRLLNAGVAVLGLIDDLAPDEPRGVRAHATAGRLTTGHAKALGTVALAWHETRDVRATAVIALSAHVFNVLDTRPGRAIKAFTALLLATPRGTGIAPQAGPLLVLGAYDLRERAMLGDTGSTLLGALAGRHLTNTLDGRGITMAASSLAAISLFAELVSLSAVIDRVPPLRALDWLGRRTLNA
jgi:hypothetical protein